jgi:divalent metal cation (Fe/Co/Zn/Cd) transporter
MFASSIIFGMGFHFVGRLIAKVLTGRWEALPGLSLITGIVSSIVTFLSVKYVIIYLL